MQFPYSELNGILKHLYDKDNSYFNKSIEQFSSGESSKYIRENAFNFGSSSYWTDDTHGNQEYENYIGFCFKTGKATLIGYEFWTSGEGARPRIWSLSGSNDRVHWRRNTTVDHPMEKNETYYTPWNKGTFRCFRFDMLKNVYDAFVRSSDIKQIEIFGTYYLTDPEFIVCSKFHRKRININFVISILISRAF